MSELAERVSRLRARLWTKIGFDTNDQDFTQRYAKLIEQALLAERRLAMEEAAGICLNEASYHKNDTKAFGKGAGAAFAKAAERIRAAAEKEVSNG